MIEGSERMGNSSKLRAQCRLPDKALELIGSRAEGMPQSELRRLLRIESSKCSRIVSKLERSGLIKRDKISAGGHRTFLIRLTAPPKKEKASFCRSIDTYLTEIYLLYLMRCSSS